MKNKDFLSKLNSSIALPMPGGRPPPKKTTPVIPVEVKSVEVPISYSGDTGSKGRPRGPKNRRLPAAYVNRIVEPEIVQQEVLHNSMGKVVDELDPLKTADLNSQATDSNKTVPLVEADKDQEHKENEDYVNRELTIPDKGGVIEFEQKTEQKQEIEIDPKKNEDFEIIEIEPKNNEDSEIIETETTQSESYTIMDSEEYQVNKRDKFSEKKPSFNDSFESEYVACTPETIKFTELKKNLSRFIENNNKAESNPVLTIEKSALQNEPYENRNISATDKPDQSTPVIQLQDSFKEVQPAKDDTLEKDFNPLSVREVSNTKQIQLKIPCNVSHSLPHTVLEEDTSCESNENVIKQKDNDIFVITAHRASISNSGEHTFLKETSPTQMNIPVSQQFSSPVNVDIDITNLHHDNVKGTAISKPEPPPKKRDFQQKVFTENKRVPSVDKKINPLEVLESSDRNNIGAIPRFNLTKSHTLQNFGSSDDDKKKESLKETSFELNQNAHCEISRTKKLRRRNAKKYNNRSAFSQDKEMGDFKDVEKDILYLEENSEQYTSNSNSHCSDIKDRTKIPIHEFHVHRSHDLKTNLGSPMMQSKLGNKYDMHGVSKFNATLNDSRNNPQRHCSPVLSYSPTFIKQSSLDCKNLNPASMNNKVGCNDIFDRCKSAEPTLLNNKQRKEDFDDSNSKPSFTNYGTSINNVKGSSFCELYENKNEENDQNSNTDFEEEYKYEFCVSYPEKKAFIKQDNFAHKSSCHSFQPDESSMDSDFKNLNHTVARNCIVENETRDNPKSASKENNNKRTNVWESFKYNSSRNDSKINSESQVREIEVKKVEEEETKSTPKDTTKLSALSSFLSSIKKDRTIDYDK